MLLKKGMRIGIMTGGGDAPGLNGIFIRGRATSFAGPSMRSRMRF